MAKVRFRPGDKVGVRPPTEILATLDATGALNHMPFMPEMLQYSGQTFVVSKRAEKICDTVSSIGGSRRMRGTVYLDGLRCDGSAHGGCEQECRLYWKEEWLTKADSETPSPRRVEPAASAEPKEIFVGDVERSEAFRAQMAEARRVLMPHTIRGEGVYQCQATEAFRATERLSVFELGQYVREIRSGNANLAHFARVAVRAIWQRVAKRIRLARFTRQMPNGVGLHEKCERLYLQPGELVEVKSEEEIVRTLDKNGKNRGLFFSYPEQLPLVGKRFRVRRLLNRIIDEKSGRMISFKSDCVVLDGCVCLGDRAAGRWFCGREIFPYWREAWLKRVGAPPMVQETREKRWTRSAVS